MTTCFPARAPIVCIAFAVAGCIADEGEAGDGGPAGGNAGADLGEPPASPDIVGRDAAGVPMLDADAAPEPAPDAAPRPGCEGRYTVSSWVVVESGFDATGFNDFLATQIQANSLVLSAVALVDAEGLTLALQQLGPDGQPLPDVPAGEPLHLDADGAGNVSTRTPGSIVMQGNSGTSGTTG